MPRVSTDYLNARRESAGRKGKTIFAPASHTVDLRSQWNSLNPLERAILESDHVFADFKRWFAHLQPVGDLIGGVAPDHGALLAPGETPDDLCF